MLLTGFNGSFSRVPRIEKDSYHKTIRMQDGLIQDRRGVDRRRFV